MNIVKKISKSPNRFNNEDEESDIDDESLDNM